VSAILHLLSRSARQGDSLQQCVLHIGAGDALILLEEAVLEAVHDSHLIDSLQDLGVAVYVMQADLLLRGLGEFELASGVTAIDYVAMTGLITDFELSQTWS
jgi:sulfur relay protein TusB/DsrH